MYFGIYYVISILSNDVIARVYKHRILVDSLDFVQTSIEFVLELLNGLVGLINLLK